MAKRRRSEISEPPGKDGSQRDEACGGEGYVPASFEKRTAAWMGLAYMLMLLFVINFAIYTGGRELPGTFPLFLVPVSVALAVILARRLKTGGLPGGRVGGVVMIFACAAGAVLGLVLGVPALLAALGA